MRAFQWLVLERGGAQSVTSIYVIRPLFLWHGSHFRKTDQIDIYFELFRGVEILLICFAGDVIFIDTEIAILTYDTAQIFKPVWSWDAAKMAALSRKMTSQSVYTFPVDLCSALILSSALFFYKIIWNRRHFIVPCSVNCDVFSSTFGMKTVSYTHLTLPTIYSV